MFLQITHAAIDDGAGDAGVFGTSAHEAAVDCVGDLGGRGDEEDGVCGDGVDLGEEGES